VNKRYSTETVIIISAGDTSIVVTLLICVSLLKSRKTVQRFSKEWKDAKKQIPKNIVRDKWSNKTMDIVTGR
jgi:hypothetical protein